MGTETVGTGGLPETAEDSVWRIVRRELRHADPKNRRIVFFAVGAVTFGLLLSAADILTGSNEGELYRLTALQLGTVGLLLFAVANTVYAASRGETAAPFSGLRETRPPGFNRVLLALPTMNLASALLLAAAITCMVPGLLRLPVAVMVPVGAVTLGLYGVALAGAARAVIHTARFLYREVEARDRALVVARGQAAEAELGALQAQLNPHFLFNALNTIASLVRSDPRRAEVTVENLAGVLRRTLDRSRRVRSTVGEELEYLEAYLAVAEARWGDRLRIKMEIEPGSRAAPIPPLTLQPLVENALKHGIGQRLDAGTIEIRSALTNGMLRLSVIDDGQGPGPRTTDGTGLANLRARLATIYGASAELSLRRQGAVTVAEISMPGEWPAGAPS